jgi:hypothetical protein
LQHRRAHKRLGDGLRHRPGDEAHVAIIALGVALEDDAPVLNDEHGAGFAIAFVFARERFGDGEIESRTIHVLRERRLRPIGGGPGDARRLRRQRRERLCVGRFWRCKNQNPSQNPN